MGAWQSKALRGEIKRDPVERESLPIAKQSVPIYSADAPPFLLWEDSAHAWSYHNAALIKDLLRASLPLYWALLQRPLIYLHRHLQCPHQNHM